MSHSNTDSESDSSAIRNPFSDATTTDSKNKRSQRSQKDARVKSLDSRRARREEHEEGRRQGFNEGRQQGFNEGRASATRQVVSIAFASFALNAGLMALSFYSSGFKQDSAVNNTSCSEVLVASSPDGAAGAGEDSAQVQYYLSSGGRRKSDWELDRCPSWAAPAPVEDVVYIKMSVLPTDSGDEVKTQVDTVSPITDLSNRSGE